MDEEKVEKKKLTKIELANQRWLNKKERKPMSKKQREARDRYIINSQLYYKNRLPGYLSRTVRG